MLAQGVLTPEEASEAWVGDEYTGYPHVQVYAPSLGGVSLVVVDENGEVQAQRAYLWSPLYPNYEARLEAMARHVQLLQSGKIPCTLSLVPR